MSWEPSEIPRGRGVVRLEVKGRVAEIVLDNPAARNAVSVGMMADFGQIVRQLEDSDVLAVIIRGVAAGGFCAGGDLRDVRAHLLTEASARGMPQYMGDVLDRLASLPAVIVAAVEGSALGGGAELVTVADWVIASEDARLGFVHAALGVSPGWGGARRLVQRVGRRAAMTTLLQARRHDAESAQALGLVDQVVPVGGAALEARKWIESILCHPADAVLGALRILRTSGPVDEALANTEREVFAQLWGAEAHQRALSRVKAGE